MVTIKTADSATNPYNKCFSIISVLIELPIDLIKQFLSDFEYFKAMVLEANTLIE